MRFCLRGSDGNDKIEISVLEASEEVPISPCEYDLTLTVDIDAGCFHVKQATTGLDCVSTLKAFLSELENCYNTLDGEALFEDDSWGPDFWFRVKMEPKGHAYITGMMRKRWDTREYQLDFAMESEQSFFPETMLQINLILEVLEQKRENYYHQARKKLMEAERNAGDDNE